MDPILVLLNPENSILIFDYEEAEIGFLRTRKFFVVRFKIGKHILEFHIKVTAHVIT